MPWALMGAFAALIYRATPRATADVDLRVARSPGVPRVLAGAGYDVTVQRDGDKYSMIRARKADVAVDLLCVQVEYQQGALDRARDHVLTAEDVIVHKLIAWRPRDRSDIESILANPNVAVEEGYVEHWAREWEVLDRWLEAKSGA